MCPSLLLYLPQPTFLFSGYNNCRKFEEEEREGDKTLNYLR
jgi:hypothetical protein